MIDREKVIKGLGEILVYCHEQFGENDYDVQAQLTRMNQTAKDAIELLKAQEPRVMTLAEALAADYVYLEIRLHSSLPCDCCILAIDPDGGILPLHKGFCAYLDGEEYGIDWRCWTSWTNTGSRPRFSWWTSG